jgi:RNA polymerase sigma-70 factor (ECF subfamily)
VEITNSDIILAFKQGDKEVFEKLFRSYYQSLCRYANGLLNDTDEAEEVVQQVFVTIWEKRTSIEIKISFKSYLYRAVHNSCLNHIEKLKVRQIYVAQQSGHEEVSAEHSETNLQKNELQARISSALLKLPEQCRKVFLLSRQDEMKYAEIADHLGISIKTVENQMGKALRIMREELKEYLPLVILIISLVKPISI